MKPETSKSRFRNNLWLGLVASSVFFVFAASCNYSEQKQMAPTTSNGQAVNDLDWLMTNLFHQSCVSCHNGGRQPGGFKFETAGDLMSQSRTGGITPGASGSSQVFQSTATGRMPLGNNKPSAATIEVLRCWIDAGATQDSAQCVPTGADAQPSKQGGNGGGNGGGNDVAVLFSQVAPILDANCIGCHGERRGAAGVRLHTFEAVTEPASGPQIVTCGDAATSLLYQVLIDDSMPMGGDPLSAEQKQVISSWIAGGCKP